MSNGKNQDNRKGKITIVDKNGVNKDYNVLLTFHSDDYDRSYVLLYPENNNENKSTAKQDLDVQAFALNKQDDPTDLKGGDLLPIESDKEWNMVQEVLNTFISDDKMNKDN